MKQDDEKSRHGKCGRKPYPGCELDLPLPPALGADSAEHLRWAAAAGAAIDAAGLLPLPGVTKMLLFAGPIPDRGDLSTVQRHVAELLQDRGLIEQNTLVDFSARWDRVIDSGRVRVIVRQTRPPLERIGAVTRRLNGERQRGLSEMRT